MSLTGYNYDGGAVKCGVKIVMQKAQNDSVRWISDFTAAETFITIPANSAGSGTVRKTIPFTWDATSTSEGSDYKVYTIHEDGTVWGKFKDNFNITKSVACNADSDCDDGNGLTADACSNPGTKNAACTHTPITFACNTNTDCNDNDARTIDVCNNQGALSAECLHNAVACFSNADCGDGDPITVDTCNNAGTPAASCTHLGVTATAASSSLVLEADEVQTTLTCTVAGTAALLEARCSSTAAWTAISSGDTRMCSYTSVGSYTSLPAALLLPEPEAPISEF